MLKILKILRRADQNNCLNMVHTITTQLTQGNTETSSEGLLKIQDPQVTFKGLSDLFIKYILEAIFILVFYRKNKNKYSFVLNGDIRETSTNNITNHITNNITISQTIFWN